MSRILTLVVLLTAAPAAPFEGRIVDGAGAPIAGAEVSILGYPGAVRTGADGFFEWSPDPALPFDVFVTLPGGTYMSPVHVTELSPTGPTEIVVLPLVSEAVTVTSGAAPSIDAPPAAATTAIPREEIQSRHPARLTDVVANVAGAGTLSDLHASVPSLRGLARGRTLLLIDGARVTTERRAGPSATFLDPFFLEGVEVSRGPGSVGYGSDAFGGVIHARTRKVEAGAPTHVRLRGALGAGLPEATGGVELTHGLDEGGVVLQARYRTFDSYRSPDGEVFNSQASDRGFLGRFGHRAGSGTFEAGWQTSLARDTGRPDTRGEAVQTSYPEENSHRLTMSYDLDPRAGFTRIGFHGFWGRYQLVTETFSPRGRQPPGRRRHRERLQLSELRRAPGGAGPLGDGGRSERTLRAPGDRPHQRVLGEAPPRGNARDRLRAAHRHGTLYEHRDPSGELVVARCRCSIRSGLDAERGRLLRRSIDVECGDVGLRIAEGRARQGVELTGQLARGFRDPTLSDRYFRGSAAAAS